MAKATKGSADPRAAAGELSIRDQTTATARIASQEPAGVHAGGPSVVKTVLRGPNGRFVSVARGTGDAKVTVAANQTKPRKATATSRTGSTAKSTSSPARPGAAKTAPANAAGSSVSGAARKSAGAAGAARKPAAAPDAEAVRKAAAATAAEATGTEATGAKATGTEATGAKATGTEATATKATATKAAGTKATGTEATGTEATGAAPAKATRSKSTRTAKPADEAGKAARKTSTRTKAAQAEKPPTPVKAARPKTTARRAEAAPAGRGKPAGTRTAASRAPAKAASESPAPAKATPDSSGPAKAVPEKKAGTTARRSAAKAATAAESTAPEQAAAPKTRSTRQSKAKAAPAETPADRSSSVTAGTPTARFAASAAEAPVDRSEVGTAETTVTVDLRVPEAAEAASVTVRPAVDDPAPAEAERAPQRPPVRSGGVVSPTKTPADGRAGGPAATRPRAGTITAERPAGARSVDIADSPTTHARRRRTMVLMFAIVAILVMGVSLFVRRHTTASSPTVVPAASQLPPVPPSADAAVGPATKAKAAPPADSATTGPSTASGKFTYAPGYGPLLGTDGTMRRFHVAVESTIGQGDGGGFADEIDSVLGDPRSWIAGREVRLQRVPQQAAAEFTVFLASPRTSERMCAAGGLATNGYTSCRLPGQVIINGARWQNAVPGLRRPIATYRAYAINQRSATSSATVMRRAWARGGRRR